MHTYRITLDAPLTLEIEAPDAQSAIEEALHTALLEWESGVSDPFTLEQVTCALPIRDVQAALARIREMRQNHI